MWIGRARLGNDKPWLVFDECSWQNLASDMGQGLAAWGDGFVPFSDPFARYYDASSPALQGSRFMGSFTRDAMIAVAGAPNLPAWLKSPALYEVGQMTVPARVYGAMQGMGAVEKGGYLLSTYGARGLPGLSLGALRTGQFAKTVGTGLTPGGYLAGAGILHGADRLKSGRW